MIDFNNTKSAFAHHSNWELKKAFYLFSIIKYGILVKLGSYFLKICFKLRFPIKNLVKKTIFSHFCGCENINDCELKINHLFSFGIASYVTLLVPLVNVPRLVTS